MNKLSVNEVTIVNNFSEYFNHLQESKLLIGVGLVDEEDTDKVFALNTAVATALTVLKGKEVEDYFA